MNASHDAEPQGFWAFTSSQAVRLFAAATALSLLIAAVLGADGVPLHRPALDTPDIADNLLIQIVQIPVALFIIGVAFVITRKRPAIDFEARTPERSIAKRETLGLLVYGAVVLAVGHWFGIGMHLHGSVFGPTREVLPSEVYIWAAFNFLAFAMVPYAWFRTRGYGHRAMCLKSANVRNDGAVILAVLVLESIVELTTFPDLLSLGPRQLLIGMPLTFILHLLGTGFPVMIFAYAILFPRYVTLVGAPAAVVLGALTYAGLHVFEYWTAYHSITSGVLSVVFVFLQFGFPGLIKSYLTLRTGNAWVHLWAYHAIAPHVTVDTPQIVRAFGIR